MNAQSVFSLIPVIFHSNIVAKQYTRCCATLIVVCLGEISGSVTKKFTANLLEHIASASQTITAWQNLVVELALNLFYCQQLCMLCSQQNAYLYWISWKIVAQKCATTRQYKTMRIMKSTHNYEMASNLVEFTHC